MSIFAILFKYLKNWKEVINMSKFFCSTKDKDVDIQINRVRSTSNEDDSEQFEKGTSVCFEAKYGNCFEHENCPLRRK